MRNIKTFLLNLSHHPGVYQMLGKDGEVLYVGKAKDLKKRISSYFSSRAKDAKTLSLVQQIADIDVTVTNSENEAVLLECNLIKKHRPRYNILLRDDKSYPYILITNQHDYPRIDIYRGQRKKNGLYFGPFPNSTAVRETISLLQKLFRIRTCQDSFFEARSRPCLLYQIGRCSGPCVNLISKEEYAKSVRLAVLFLEGRNDEIIQSLQTQMEQASQALDYELAAHLRDQITRLRQIQDKQYVNVSEGSADVIGYAMAAGMFCIQLLSIRHGQILGSRSYYPRIPPHSHAEEIISAFISQHYFNDRSHQESIPKFIVTNLSIDDKNFLEVALSKMSHHKVIIMTPQKGDKKKWLEMAMTNARQSLATHLYSNTNMEERLVATQKALGLKKIPHRIECYDISHSMGEATVGSCVVFNESGPLKSDYRRYNVQGITPGDDLAAMHQVLMRRFKKISSDESKIPDLVLIDGGKTQLAMAKTVLDELQIKSVTLIGVSKGVDRKPGFETLHRIDSAPIHLPSDSSALHFIQQIRDEAHRFAITGHRQQRDKARRKSSLEYIPGIGTKRRRELLRYFGGIQGVAHASLDELTKVPGISRGIAERIFAALHDTIL
ncbi:MAG: hypothetical protein ACD_46C00680G0002 [uncultured bacterium]|nr:MAG: hypothetical protein ACD_46C00680G0002 [uncultured bacterium]